MAMKIIFGFGKYATEIIFVFFFIYCVREPSPFEKKLFIRFPRIMKNKIMLVEVQRSFIINHLRNFL